VADEKDDEIARLRRMFAEAHEKRQKPSRLDQVVSRLRLQKTKNNLKSKEEKEKKTDAA
jgi:hypothetical protein